ncbi:deoxyguanosinetriphosphate triphosphohydrolase [Blastococcus sp. Marseille-P5729]|uniref:deoxyguanosinetriphosphate triphosphohydrolase n=1 Tax=Blastococcus sp. Marseille-P5729 TaxID=2086582 RepID=UPI0018FEF357|nr:deoxyguanosinetriphosphate triphosphohydrolase [Blastococcus sp. Marseille-P5729]
MSYTAADTQRFVREPGKSSYFAGGEGAVRSEFARDRARILHSSALRRLAGKTQVVVPGEDDFPRTRLTHSLEVAQIAREMGAALGLDPDITDAAGLAHDLGHPPFGHNGERALDEVSDECGGFEGNAQTLRVVARLESKVLAGEINAGLNLTRAVLDSTCKYPWPRRAGVRKFGVYADDLPTFEWARAGIDHQRPCMEAQVMDWADDIAYSVHDVEDGAITGLLDLSRLADPEEAAVVCAIAAGSFVAADPAGLQSVLSDLLALPVVQDVAAYGAEVGSSRRGRVALKRATSELLGRFSAAAIEATRREYGEAPLTRYHASLVIPDVVAAECALLKATAVRYVMEREGAAELQRWQRSVLKDLVAALRERPEELVDQHADAYAAASDDGARLRAIIDQVAELTDKSAVLWRNRLCGDD